MLRLSVRRQVFFSAESEQRSFSHFAKDWEREKPFLVGIAAQGSEELLSCFGYFAWRKLRVYGSSFWERAQERADSRLVTLPSSWASKTWASILPIAGPGGTPI